MPFFDDAKLPITNALYFADRQGLPLAISNPVAGNHHDLYNIENSLDELFQTLTLADNNLDGLFVNADAGLTQPFQVGKRSITSPLS